MNVVHYTKKDYRRKMVQFLMWKVCNHVKTVSFEKKVKLLGQKISVDMKIVLSLIGVYKI